MGKQINFYFDADDDKILGGFLFNKHLVCIPRMNPDPIPAILDPISAVDLAVKLIPAEYATEVLPLLSTPNNHFWHLIEHGVYIDWQRCKPNTTKHARYDGPPVYSQPGRFYFPTISAYETPTPLAQAVSTELNKVMAAIVRKVKSHATHISENGNYYIGRHLADAAGRGNAIVLAGNGVTPIRLVET